MAASIKTALAIGSGLLVLGAGVGVASVAYADAPVLPTPTTPAPSAPAPSNPVPDTEPPTLPTNPDQDEALIKTLSSLLGVDEAEIRAGLDQLRAAYAAEGPAAVKQLLDQAVQSGILTQDEADAVQQAIDESMINLGPR